MRRGALTFLLVLFVSSPVFPQTPKPAKHLYDAAYIEGVRAGYFHTAVQHLERDGRPFVRTTMEMNLKIRRYGETVPLRMASTTDETPDGKITGFTLTQFLDKGQLVTAGTVEGDKLVLRAGGAAPVTLPWNPAAVGPHRQEALLAEKKAKPGDTVQYVSFEAGVMQAVTVKVAVKEPEEVDLLRAVKKDEKTAVERVTTKLLRADVNSGKVKVGDQEIPLPGLTQWLTPDYQVARAQLELPGMGTITLYRTTEEVAKQEAVGPQVLPDLGLQTLIALDKPIDNPRGAKRATYRLTVKGDEDAAGAFAQDARQAARKPQKGTFELVVTAGHPGKAAPLPAEKRAALLASSHFLDAGHERVKAHAAKAVGAETDPWKRAVAVEKWVHDNMKSSGAVGFATAGQVADTLTGDCRQHAMLAAAMCRAAGVPSRTALGLVYVRDPARGPVLGFHMWTEVLIGDEWRGLDATLGQGGLTVGHLKINDASWHDTQTLAPLLPVTRVMGKLKVEVVAVE